MTSHTTNEESTLTDTRAEFLETLRQNPDDLQTPLVFADWLEENGEEELAEFIRLQVWLARSSYPEKRTSPNLKRHTSAIAQRCKRLWKQMVGPQHMVGPQIRVTSRYFHFRRGFLHAIEWPGIWVLKYAVNIIDEAPLLRKLTVGRVNGWGERLAECPLLGRFVELELQSWISTADAMAIVDSPFLKHLQSLEICLGNLHEQNDVEILQIFAQGVKTQFPNLRELRIVDVPGCTAATVEEANRLMGRNIAVPVLPFPRIYTIADNGDPFFLAGKLPNGSQVWINIVLPGIRAHLYFFDSGGAHIETQELLLPKECRQDFEGNYQEERRVVESYFNQSLGYKPATIQIRYTDFLNMADIDPNAGDARGQPDDPSQEWFDEWNSLGYGGQAKFWVKYGGFYFNGRTLGPHGYEEPYWY